MSGYTYNSGVVSVTHSAYCPVCGVKTIWIVSERDIEILGKLRSYVPSSFLCCKKHRVRYEKRLANIEKFVWSRERIDKGIKDRMTKGVLCNKAAEKYAEMHEYVPEKLRVW